MLSLLSGFSPSDFDTGALLPGTGTEAGSARSLGEGASTTWGVGSDFGDAGVFEARDTGVKRLWSIAHPSQLQFRYAVLRASSTGARFYRNTLSSAAWALSARLVRSSSSNALCRSHPGSCKRRPIGSGMLPSPAPLPGRYLLP